MWTTLAHISPQMLREGYSFTWGAAGYWCFLPCSALCGRSSIPGRSGQEDWNSYPVQCPLAVWNFTPGITGLENLGSSLLTPSVKVPCEEGQSEKISGFFFTPHQHLLLKQGYSGKSWLLSSLEPVQWCRCCAQRKREVVRIKNSAVIFEGLALWTRMCHV